jgi:hypothetical protein
LLGRLFFRGLHNVFHDGDFYFLLTPVVLFFIFTFIEWLKNIGGNLSTSRDGTTPIQV